MERGRIVRPLGELIATLAGLPRKRRTLLVGIDGPGASGKSALAGALRTLAPDRIRVVSMDDFSRRRTDQSPNPGGVGAGFEWRRLRKQVLVPLSRDESARYQRYDWTSDRLAEWHTIAVGEIVIVEGVYVLRTELQRFYDFKIWVECSSQVRLARGLRRDGQEARDLWVSEWMPEEDRYAEAHRPTAHADLIVDGCSDLSTDPTSDFDEIR